MKKPDTTQRLEDTLAGVNSEEREDLRAMWRLSANAEETPNVQPDQVDALWKQLAAAANDLPNRSITATYKQDRSAIRRASRKPAYRLWPGVTIALLVAITSVVLWLQPIVKTAPYGEQLAINFSDGSTVELNSGSIITYPRFFSGHRTVSLQGEAYFDVFESDIPFIVQTFNAEVQVLGTTFNVKAWESGWRPESKVTLTSGSVRFTARHAPNQSQVIAPGQTITLRHGNESTLEIDSENVEHAIAWRKGELLFKDQELASVLEEIERRFGIEIDLQVNHLAHKEVTFAYRQATSPQSILEDLCHALDLKYRPISNGYELFEE